MRQGVPILACTRWYRWFILTPPPRAPLARGCVGSTHSCRAACASSGQSRCRRSYQYLLINQPVAPAILEGKAGWYHRPLDIEAMRAAASLLVGEHDFSAFRASECQAKSPIKQLYQADVARVGDCILFNFRASAFLHHQVRNMVGALVYVGKGSHAPAWMATLLAEKNRKLAPPTFAADGLYLTGVDYDPQWGLPACQRSLTAFPMPLG